MPHSITIAFGPIVRISNGAVGGDGTAEMEIMKIDMGMERLLYRIKKNGIQKYIEYPHCAMLSRLIMRFPFPSTALSEDVFLLYSIFVIFIAHVIYSVLMSAIRIDFNIIRYYIL